MIAAFAATYSKELVTILGVVLAFLLARVFRIKAKLIYSIRHSFNFIVEHEVAGAKGELVNTKQIINTASIFAQNTGLSPAKGTEFTFNWKPPVFNVQPARHFTEHLSAMGRYTIRLDSLAPGEAFAIEIMSFNADLPVLTAVRSDDAEGQLVITMPQRQYSTLINRIVLFLILAGFAGSIYSLAVLIQWIAT